MKKIVLALCATAAVALASPAYATIEVGGEVGCATAPLNPGADKCDGYFSQNVLSNTGTDVAAQQSALDALLGTGAYTVDFNALKDAGLVVSDGNLSALNSLLATAGGQVVLGIHWGNVPESGNTPYGNVSAFYLWDNATAGSIHLTNTQGYSNAVLYRATGAVPEPATWAMMLLGFGAIGMASRRRQKPVLAQIA